jgi:superfamily II DNA or RNA helicase
MPSVSLRQYQRRMLYDIKTAFHVGKNPLVVAPTGAGKMVLIAFLAVELKCRVLIVEHRIELIDQAVEKLNLIDVAPGIIAADYKPKPTARIDKTGAADICVGMVQTLARRPLEGRDFEVIVVDEAHLSQANSYLRLKRRWPEAKRVGLTATPERLDGRGFEPFFDTLIHGPTIPDLTSLGFLCRVELYTAVVPDMSDVNITRGDYDQLEVAARLNNKKLVGDVVEQWGIHARGLTTVVFATSRAHSQSICDAFVANGVKAVHMDGDTPDAVRRDNLDKLRSGEITVCCNCGILIEGVDVPNIGCVILAMATQSISRYLQSIGRGMRPCPGKSKLIVLDHGGNYRIHGSPDAVHVWTLDGRPPRVVKHKEDLPTWIDPEKLEQPPVPTGPPTFLPSAASRPPPEHLDGNLEYGPEGYLPVRRRRLVSPYSGQEPDWYDDDASKRARQRQPRLVSPYAAPALPAPEAPVARPVAQPAQPAPEVLHLRPGQLPPRPCPSWAKGIEAVWNAAEIERIRKNLSLSSTTVKCRLWLAGVRK